MIVTSFKILKDKRACTEGYKQLSKALGGISNYGRNADIKLSTVLAANGRDDFSWVINEGAVKNLASKDVQLRFLWVAFQCLRVYALLRNRPDAPSRVRTAVHKVMEGAAPSEADSGAWEEWIRRLEVSPAYLITFNFINQIDHNETAGCAINAMCLWCDWPVQAMRKDAVLFPFCDEETAECALRSELLSMVCTMFDMSPGTHLDYEALIANHWVIKYLRDETAQV